MSTTVGDGFDGRLLELFIDHRTPGLVRLAHDVTTYGNYVVLVVIAIAAGLLLLWRTGQLRAAAAPLATLLVTGAVVAGAKAIVGRERPPLGLRLAHEADRSFPSGHAADGTALYLTLALVVAATLLHRPVHRRVLVGAAAVWSVLIGLSRLVLGVHWPTDVLAGWVLGAGMAMLGASLAVTPDRWSARRGTAGADPTPAGAGLPPPR
jgi:membrane-associated phospholipid phosphatase